MKAATYRKGKPEVVDLSVIDDAGHLLEASAAVDFALMQAAALRDGVTFVINSAFREHEHQQRLYKDYQRKMAHWEATGRDPAKRPFPVGVPGFSLHQSGKAVDIETAGGTNAAYLWLEKHAAGFGFKRTVPREAWHFEHVR